MGSYTRSVGKGIQKVGTASAKAQSLPHLESKAFANQNCSHPLRLLLGFMGMEVKPFPPVSPYKISFLFWRAGL